MPALLVPGSSSPVASPVAGPPPREMGAAVATLASGSRAGLGSPFTAGGPDAETAGDPDEDDCEDGGAGLSSAASACLESARRAPRTSLAITNATMIAATAVPAMSVHRRHAG